LTGALQATGGERIWWELGKAWAQRHAAMGLK